MNEEVEQAEEVGTYAEEAAAPEAPQAPAAPSAPIFRGIQRDIATPEELSAYALSLERQVLEQQAQLGGLGRAQAPVHAEPAAQDSDFYKQVSVEFITNPETAIKRIEERVYGRINGAVEQRLGVNEFHRSFYAENEDLVGCEDIVESTMAKNRSKWDHVPTPQAKKLLAAAVRERLNAIRGGASASPARVTELPARGAPGLPASGASARPSKGNAPAANTAPTTIAGMLKAQRAKRFGG